MTFTYYSVFMCDDHTYRERTILQSNSTEWVPLHDEVDKL